MRKLVELRIRPGARPGFRMEVGVAKDRAQLGELYRQRDVLKRIHARGEFDVLEAAKLGSTTPAELSRLVDAHGWDDYRRFLKLAAPKVNGAHVLSLDKHSERWLDTIPKRQTAKVYRKGIAYLRDFTVDGERLGARPWPEIPRHVIRDVKASLRERLAGNTIRTVMASWSGFYEWAIDRDKSEAEEKGRAPLLEANPVRTAKVWDPIEITRHRFLAWDEAQRLFKVSPESMRIQYATLCFTGLRIGEFLMLPPAHVILPTHLHVGPVGSWVPKGYPRSKRGVRDVPLHRDLVPQLELYAATYAGTETFFVNPTNGKPWSGTAFEDRLAKDLKAADLIFGQWTRSGGTLERKPEGLTAHSFRHTTASWLCQADVQMQKIALLLGDTVETITKHYAHLLPTDLDRSINRIGEGE